MRRYSHVSKKVSKYRNNKVVIDGYTFDSKKEGIRYLKLKHMQGLGVISDLELQPEFVIAEGFKLVTGETLRARKYRADFRYKENGNVVVEDVKSPITRKEPLYRLKRHLFLARYGKELIFREV